MRTPQVPQMLFSSALKLFEPYQQESFFQKGDLVDGKVLKVLDRNHVLVKLAGAELVAVTDTKLLQGQNIVGRVDKVDPQVTVSLLQGDSAKDVKTTALMRLLMPNKAAMGEAFSKIAELAARGDLPQKTQAAIDKLIQNLRQMITSDPENITPERVREAIRQSGLFMEAALKDAALGKLTGPKIGAAMDGDAKALLGRALLEVESEVARLVKQETGGAEPKVIDLSKGAPKTAAAIPDALIADLLKHREAAKVLRDGMNNIELNQLMNASTKDKEGGQQSPSLYQLPFGEGMDYKTARVYIRPRDEGKEGGRKKGKDESAIVFMLDMSRLGPVRVDVNVGAGRVNGTVYVLNDSIAYFVSGKLPELLKPLEVAGYQVRFDVSSADKKFVTEELENYTPITQRGMVDVKA